MSKSPQRLPPLDLLVSFEAVARRGSITAAAAERFITQSAMSRQVQALEAALGTPLFQRRHRALVLTAAGQRLLLATSAALAQLGDAVAAIRAPAARAQLALTTTPSFAALWLIPRLASFTRDHPGMDVRLDASFERRDLVRDGFDLAVRYGPVAQADGERLFGEVLVPVCSPALLRRKPHPLATPADLVHHTLLQVSASPGGSMPLEWEPWLRQLGQPQLQPQAQLTFNNYNEAVAAAVAGQGVTLGRRPLIDALLKKHQLVVPFGEATDTARAYFLLLAPAMAQRPDVQALAAWLRAQAAAAG
jgi:LysR family transcriptional regulator, glycine cleavage system transcriptional activator